MSNWMVFGAVLVVCITKFKSCGWNQGRNEMSVGWCHFGFIFYFWIQRTNLQHRTRGTCQLTHLSAKSFTIGLSNADLPTYSSFSQSYNNRIFKCFRYYLRNREDTIKCIINSLIDDGPSELADELVKGEKSALCDTSFTEEDLENWDHWTPDPIDADSSMSL